eukprot:38613-Chlamydomonas_euryale.AAC.4
MEVGATAPIGKKQEPGHEKLSRLVLLVAQQRGLRTSDVGTVYKNARLLTLGVGLQEEGCSTILFKVCSLGGSDLLKRLQNEQPSATSPSRACRQKTLQGCGRTMLEEKTLQNGPGNVQSRSH